MDIESKERERKVRIPTQERGINKRNRIVNGAARLFSEKGYYNTNSIKIAKEAGVPIGSFYTYFGDKKSLFLEILRDHSLSVVKEVLGQVSIKDFEGLSKRETLYKLIKLDIAMHRIAPKFDREAEMMKFNDKDVEGIHNEEEDLVVKYLVALFETMSDRIRVKDFEATARLVRISVEAVVHYIEMFTPRIDEERLINELIDMLYMYIFN
jgi:AcrR family transcriptional regulator